MACLNVGCDSAGVSLLGDRLFCVGGYDGQGYLSLVQAYDPQTNEWSQVSSGVFSVKVNIFICLFELNFYMKDYIVIRNSVKTKSLLYCIT